MKDQIKQIRIDAEEAIKSATSEQEIEALRIRFLGKKGELTAILKQMGGVSPEERPVIGQLANEVRSYIENEIATISAQLKSLAASKKLENETIDVTMPGNAVTLGQKHPLNIVLDEIKEIFLGMGFDVVEGPEVELDYYNFEALNIPKDHPARDTQDTFYITENILLRTQTSPVQVRVMEKQKPPIRVISPGRVYRSDAVDATHSPVFHQSEGLVVDKGITMGDLK
ncbi:MAG: phenylalanine--tRNA ligase subunit alpha, partial [Clostridia bacterium]|nr:phenylalanine--tRNA ligase subunit alpha [Clostridia bacterium]